MLRITLPGNSITTIAGYAAVDNWYWVKLWQWEWSHGEDVKSTIVARELLWVSVFRKLDGYVAVLKTIFVGNHRGNYACWRYLPDSELNTFLAPKYNLVVNKGTGDGYLWKELSEY